MNHEKCKNMIICGGGINGIAIVGALYEFMNKDLIKNFNTFMGISVGALISLLLVTGYNKDEIMNIFLDIEMEEFSDFKITRFLKDYGLDNGENIKKLLKALLIYKEYSPDLTFQELLTKTNKNLIIVGTNVNLGRPIFYNAKNFPNKKIVDAIRVSVSFPGIYTPVIDGDHFLVDGGILEPYPIDYFDDPETVIGFLIKNNIPNCEKIKHYNTDSLESYYMSIINILLDAYLEKCFKGNHKYTVYIDKEDLVQNMMDYSLTKEIKLSLVEAGKNAFNKYMNQFIKNNKKIE